MWVRLWFVVFFCFKQKTGYGMRISDWSSDVCSSDLITRLVVRQREQPMSSNTALVCADSFNQIASLLRHMDGALGGLLSAFELVDNSFYRANTGAGRHGAPQIGRAHV